jgi:hypothetical protein
VCSVSTVKGDKKAQLVVGAVAPVSVEPRKTSAPMRQGASVFATVTRSPNRSS